MNPLWLTGRATGLVSLILLTVTVVLGLLDASRTTGPRTPRFVVGALHRNASLWAVLFLAVHVTTAVIDPYAGIGWLETVVPFTSTYEPFALGLGAVVLDVMFAVVMSSIVRRHLARRSWRAIHVVGYACWPVAVAHGLLVGGADSATGWVLAVYAVCSAAVVAALVRRLTHEPAPGTPRVGVP
jgi:DMSO/TMAO reductase YedYZ heme-binding membrane subunit